MSQVKISGDPSGTGIFTISAPNSSTNRALVLPDSAGTLATSASTLAQFNVSGSAPVFACRAWVNFNGTGTVAIRASGNVSSITDVAGGSYLMNFTTAMEDTNYCCTMNGRTGGGVQSIITLNRDNSPTTTSNPIYVVNPSTPQILQDEAFIMVAVFR